MRLKITHRIEYRHDGPIPYALQRVRLLPCSGATQKVIARRVAGALNQSAAAGFGEELGARLENATETLEQDMAALADTQLRYEASARLLQMSYSDIRTAMRDRG